MEVPIYVVLGASGNTGHVVTKNLFLEMTGSLNSGDMQGLEPRTPKNTTPTSFETFVADVFVPAYKQQAAV